MHIERDKSLRQYNTFGFAIRAEFFVSATTTDDIAAAINWANRAAQPVLVLGGGSNLVLSGDIRGLVLRVAIGGIRVRNESASSVQISVGAGESWHGLVDDCIDHGWFGIENLALIPGQVGAAPIQNIGAYGVELSDHFCSLQALALHGGAELELHRADCCFGYRNSIFKHELRQTHVITEVTLRLSKEFAPVTSHAEVSRQLALAGRSPVDARLLHDVVCSIRRAKLPDPAQCGNAGSFFTNPIISSAQFAALQARWPAMVGFPVAAGGCKVSAAWLIEQCGWKGYREGEVGVHDRQALVLVNHGRGSGAEIVALARKIRDSVHGRFGIALQTEPVVL